MATIDPTDLRTKRGASSFYLSIFQPATLLAASVNNGSIARGARTIAYDGGSGTGFSTIEAFQLLEVDTADGTKYVRLKSITGNQTSGTITVDENAIDWADNQVIRVKHFYPLVPIPPSIRSQIFYKFYSTAYSDQNSLVNPVAIIGSHLVGRLSAGSVAFSLNSSSSYAVAQGASISSRVWSCVHNGGGTTGISFSNTTTANPTLTITQAGQYWLKCIVTDSNGKTQETFRAIFVYDDTTLPYKDFTVQSLSGDWQRGGWGFNFQATGDVTLSDFPDLTLAVLWYDNTFNNVTGYVDLWGTATQQIVCAGYLRKDQDNDKLSVGDGDVNFEVTTPEAVMDNMSELGSISLNAVATPNRWYKYASWMTVGRAIHHVLKWHSSVLETCDVLGLTGNTLGVKNADFTEPSLLQMVNGLSYQRGIFAKLVSARTGRLYLVEDSQMLNDAGRAALDTVFSITTSDISDTIDLVRNPEERIATATLDGFDFNGSASTPIISIAPGYRESAVSYGMPEFRGISSLQIKGQVLDDQTDGNEKCGRVLAQANNNPFELRFTTPYNGIGAFDIVPSIGWYQWTISDSVLARNTGLNGKNLLCRNITHTINHEQGAVSTSLVFEIEALGADGIQGNYPTGYPAPVLRTPSWTLPTSCNLTVAAPATIENEGTSGESICALSSSKYLTVYRRYTTTESARACVLDVSGSTITPGTVANLENGTIDFVNVCALSATKAIALWYKAGTGIRAMVLDISGGSITTNAIVTVATATFADTFGIAALDSTTALVSFTDSAKTQGVVLTVSGSTITVHTAADIDAAVDSAISTVVKIDGSTALVVYGQTSGSFKAVVVSSITTSFTVNTPVTITSGLALGGNVNFADLIDTGSAIVVYPDGAIIYGVILSIAGVVVTANSPTALSLSTYSADEVPSVSFTSGSVAFVSYSQLGIGGGISVAINGTIITVTDRVDMGTAPGGGSTWYSNVAAISATQAIVAYDDDGDSAYPKAVIIECA